MSDDANTEKLEAFEGDDVDGADLDAAAGDDAANDEEKK